MLRRRLLPILVLLGGCSVPLADAVPVSPPAAMEGSASARPPASTSTSTSTSTTTEDLPAAQPSRTATTAPGSGGLSDLSSSGGSGGEGIDPLLDVVGDPGRDDPACPVPARRGLDPVRPRYLATVNADPGSGTVEGHLTVQFTPDLPVDRVELRLWANGPRDRGRRRPHRGRLTQRQWAAGPARAA